MQSVEAPAQKAAKGTENRPSGAQQGHQFCCAHQGVRHFGRGAGMRSVNSTKPLHEKTYETRPFLIMNQDIYKTDVNQYDISE